MTTAEDQPRYSLSELTHEAGVSVRTVRYYIAEGLLPPPIAAGPRSFYTQSHLDRLRLIDRMKTSYLPLKEIRRRLTALDDDEVRRLAGADGATGAGSSRAARTMEESPPEPPDSASSYIARLLHRYPPSPAAKTAAPVQAALRTQDVARAAPRATSEEPVAAVQPLVAEPPPSVASSPAADAGSWRRIALGDDAELLIRDEVYLRKRDRVEWLVGWAKKVFA
jgi:DNA-binding transcriptional MerR regulator